MIQMRNAAPAWSGVQEAVQEEAERQAVQEALNNAVKRGSDGSAPCGLGEALQQILDSTGDDQSNNESPVQLGFTPGWSSPDSGLEELAGAYLRGSQPEPDYPQNPPNVDTGPAYSPEKQAQEICDAFMSQSPGPAPALPGWVGVSSEGTSNATDAVPHKPILRPRLISSPVCGGG